MSIIQLIIKDMKNILYDAKSLAILVIMPVVIMTILGFSLRGVFTDEGGSSFKTINIALVKEYDVNQETSAFKDLMASNKTYDISDIDLESVNLEAILFDKFLDNEEIKEFIHYQIVEDKELVDLMKSNEITAAVRLPKGFIYNGYVNLIMMNRNIIDIKVEVNPKKAFSGSIVTNIFQSFSDNLNLNKARTGSFISDVIASGNLDHLNQIVDSMQGDISEVERISIHEQSVDKVDSINSFQYYSAAIMCMFLLYASTFGARAILSERKEYTMARLAVSGTKVSAVVLSNFVRITFIAVFQSSVMILFSRFFLKVKWGNYTTVVLSILILSITVGAFGMLLSVITLITNEYQIANLFEFAVIQFMALIGGSFIPLEVMPEAISNLSFLSISGLGIKLYVTGMYNQSILAEMSSLIILFTYIVVLFAASIILIKLKGNKVSTSC